MNTKDRIAALKNRQDTRGNQVRHSGPLEHGLVGKPGNATKDDPKGARLVLRCTTEELMWWKVKAENDGQTLSQLVRRLLDDY